MSFHESCLNGNVLGCVKKGRVEGARRRGGFKGRVGQSRLVDSEGSGYVWVTAIHGV